jgi:acetyl-CoA synthetase (ADP-forming)
LNISSRIPPESWQHLFSPATIAVIGASNTPGSWGNNAVKGLMNVKDRRIYPVNPNSPEVVGQKAYPTVLDIPDTIDLAVIVVPEKLVPGVMRQCVTRGVKSAIVITSGFGEMGEEGRRLEKEVADIARQGGIHFIGPNSMGHADTYSQLSTYGEFGKMPRGPVALLSQSGGTCMKIVRSLVESGIALSKYISTGNEADIIIEDYLEYLAGDDDTKVIALFIEGLRDGRRFFELAKRITPHKPIVVVKIGGTAESARAVMSHTGALAGSDKVYDAAFKQSGVIRVEDDDELIDVVYALLNSPLPRGNRAGILTIGGGQGALTAEACEKEGLVIGKLEPETVARLNKLLPARWPHRNPVDMAGPSAAEISVVASLLLAMMDDKNLDFVFVLAPMIMDKVFLSGRMGLGADGVKTFRHNEEKNVLLIRDKIIAYEKPVAMTWQWRGSNDPEVTELFHKGKFIVCANTRRAVKVLRYLVWYRQYLDSVAGR